MKQIDNITETRNSTEQPSSLWATFKSFLCPCILPKDAVVISINRDRLSFTPSVNEKTSQTNNSNNHYRYKQTFDQIIVPNRNTRRKNSLQFEESQRKQSLLRKMNTVDYQFRESFNLQSRNNRKLDEEDCPISNLTEHILLPAGSKNREILIKISTTNINIKLSLLRRDINQKKKKKNQNMEQNKYGNFEFNKYWDQRYVHFEKFDEGIKIDEKSWTVNPPQQVSQYIANKCNGAKIILDAFAGVGGNAIKLANVNSCVKVIASEQNKKRMGFLLNNAKVYEVDPSIELVEGQFLRIERNNIDVVVLQPNLAENSLNFHKDIKVEDFYPTLDKSILKAFSLASNVIMLLSPQINIDSLGTCIHRCAMQTKRMKDFCSVKIEKIYFGKQIKYIMVCIGLLVQNEVKLNEELEFMYSKLKRNKEIYFKHKKVLKKLREDYGMLVLLNLVRESERRKKQSVRNNQAREIHCIDIFYDLIRERKLISADKLSKIIMEQDAQYERQSSYYHSITFEDHSVGLEPVMQQEKIDQNPFNIRQAELTQSEYSHYSYFSSFDKKSGNSRQRTSRLMREGEKSSFGIIINRNVENDSREKNQTMSPLTPSRKGIIEKVQELSEQIGQAQSKREQ